MMIFFEKSLRRIKYPPPPPPPRKASPSIWDGFRRFFGFGTKDDPLPPTNDYSPAVSLFMTLLLPYLYIN